MLRQPILLLSRSHRVRDLITSLPITSAMVKRYVPGDTTEDAVRAAAALVEKGLFVTLDHLGEDTLDEAQAETITLEYLALLSQLAAAGLSRRAEVSLKLSAIGQALPGNGNKLALDNARRICRAARNAGTTVTVDMEDHTTTDRTLATVRELRKDFPETGAVVQSYLPRTESDCRAMAHEGSRVRLCKGAYAEPDSVAYEHRPDIDGSYVRCLKVLLAGQGVPMIATHDPRLIRIAGALATRYARPQGSYEFQMLYGIRPDEQVRLAESGETVRVYVPYGAEWYGYLMRRLAERPANLSFFLRSLLSKS